MLPARALVHFNNEAIIRGRRRRACGVRLASRDTHDLHPWSRCDRDVPVDTCIPSDHSGTLVRLWKPPFCRSPARLAHVSLTVMALLALSDPVIERIAFGYDITLAGCVSRRLHAVSLSSGSALLMMRALRLAPPSGFEEPAPILTDKGRIITWQGKRGRINGFGYPGGPRAPDRPPRADHRRSATP